MITPYENGKGCPKCRFAPNGCRSGCHVKPYYVWKGERLTPERKAAMREEAPLEQKAAFNWRIVTADEKGLTSGSAPVNTNPVIARGSQA